MAGGLDLDDPAAGAVYSFTGRVDCLVLYPDGCCGIVDYKTDRVAAGGCGLTMARLSAGWAPVARLIAVGGAPVAAWPTGRGV